MASDDTDAMVAERRDLHKAFTVCSRNPHRLLELDRYLPPPLSWPSSFDSCNCGMETLAPFSDSPFMEIAYVLDVFTPV
jgi:hypothetical protein